MSRSPSDDRHQPFRLTFRLAAPVSLSHPWLHLDSILRHVVAERTYGPDAGLEGWGPAMREDRPAEMRRAGTAKYIDTLARVRFGPGPGDWLARASVSEFGPEGVSLETLRYYKRFEPARFPGRGKVNLSSDHYRAWMLQTVYLPAATATFYGRGQMGHVRELVGDLTHLGNDARVGWGEIADWRLEPWPEDWSLVREGRAMRPLPVRMLAEWDDEAWLAWHTPYWDRGAVERCAPPGARVVLA